MSDQEKAQEAINKAVGLTAKPQQDLGFIKGNVTPEVVKEADVNESEDSYGVPEGTPDIIKNSPHAQYYCDVIRAGWTTRKCEKFALETFNEKISYGTFAKLQKLIVRTERIPDNYKRTVLNNIEANFDTLQELKNVAMLQIDRVAKGVKGEVHFGTLQGKAILPDKNVEVAIANLTLTLKNILACEVEMKRLGIDGGVTLEGEIIERGGIRSNLSGSTIEQEIKRICQEYTPEQAEKMLEALNVIEAIYVIEGQTVADIVEVSESVELIFVHSLFADDFVKVSDDWKLAYDTLWRYVADDVRIEEYRKIMLC